VSDVSEIFAGRRPWLGRVVAPLARQAWTIALVVTVGTLATLAFARMQVPLYEARAVVQVQQDADAALVSGRVLGRDNLLSLATRHGLAGAGREQVAVLMRQAVSIHDLTGEAGQTLGYAPQVSGIVVSVLLPDAERAARIANDLTQQILDMGNVGRLNPRQDELDFYRRDELRLWQEVSALQAEQDQAEGTVGAADAAIARQRRLMLMQDQYDLVRQRLAGAEIDNRLALHAQSGQFSLLSRATAAEAVNVVQDWMLVGVAGSLLLAVTLAFVLERRYPGLQRGPWPFSRLSGLRQRMGRIYAMFDDPARPILGVPRYLVTSALIVVWLYSLAAMLR